MRKQFFSGAHKMNRFLHYVLNTHRAIAQAAANAFFDPTTHRVRLTCVILIGRAESVEATANFSHCSPRTVLAFGPEDHASHSEILTYMSESDD